MQIVIELDDEMYKQIIDRNGIDTMLIPYSEIIRNGTPLPKGHGDLIDINEITAFRELECNGYDVENLDEFTVIIEADKESELNESK